ncbi:tetratricopeptide repeat protein [Actinoplanes sp. CA-252034]|uniref:tetratricopeptide repeat protein n=1 Tax=Actinoplanes sp. CA-252034 TaxID=3239906 RepID=UPI003D963713
MALIELHDGFRDGEQRRRVAGLIRTRLVDDRNDEERYSLLNLASGLSGEDGRIDDTEWAATMSGSRLAAVKALITAVRTSPDAVDDWIGRTSRSPRLFAAEPRWDIHPAGPGPDGADLAPARAAVDGGIDGAAFRLAELLEQRGELDRAAEMYRLAGETGDVQSLYALGRVYWRLDRRRSAPADERFRLPDWRITEVWQHAADLGLVEAMYAVGLIAEIGTGMSLRYLRRAADLGHLPACYALGYAADRRGSLDEAITWWTLAATSGYQPAVEALTLLEIFSAQDESTFSVRDESTFPVQEKSSCSVQEKSSCSVQDENDDLAEPGPAVAV